MEAKLIKNIINLIENNDAEILNKLLKYQKSNVDLNEYHFIDGMNLTFIGYAIVNKSFETAEILIQHGASLNCYIENDTAPIYIARNKIKLGYDLIILNHFDDTMLTLDGLDSFFSIVIANQDHILIEKMKIFINVNTVNEKNQSLLWFAAAFNNVDLIDFFVRKNLNLYQEDLNGIAPIRFLIKHNVKLKLYNFKYIDSKKNNLLMIALQEDNLELAKLILLEYQDWRFFNSQGITALELIVKKMELDFIRFLYLKKPQIFLFLKSMYPVMHTLMKRGLERIVIDIIVEYEDKINFEKIILATVENDNVEVFNYIRPRYIIEFENDMQLFEKIVKNHAINILLHIINQRMLVNDYNAKHKTLLALAKVVGNEKMTEIINKVDFLEK